MRSENSQDERAPGFVRPSTMTPMSEDDAPQNTFPTLPITQSVAPLPNRHGPPTGDTKLFTPEELTVLPSDLLNRNKLKQLAKKAKKRRMETERTEAELMLGFMGMGVEEPHTELEDIAPRISHRQLKKAKRRGAKPVVLKPAVMEVDEELSKEADFANFLANMGGEWAVPRG